MNNTPLSVCVLGNSHVGCMVTAWRRRAFAARDDIALTFFAARGLALGKLKLKKRSLIPTDEELARNIAYTSGGKERIRIPDYDVFVIVALGFAIEMGETNRGFGTVEHQQRGLASIPLSGACYRETIKAEFNDKPYMRLTRDIRSVSDAPIIHVPKPFPSESVLSDAPFSSRPEMHNDAYLSTELGIFKTATEELSTAQRAAVVWPPAATMGIPGFTKAEYARDSLNLHDTPRDSTNDDGKHMNEEYGFRMLNTVFEKLNTMPLGVRSVP